MKPTLLIYIGMMILISSCISEKSVIIRHYTIEWPDDLKVAEAEDPGLIPGQCEIDQVLIIPPYEKMQIVNRSGSHEITFYKYNQWAVRPSVAVAEVIRTYLEGVRLFERVSTRYSRTIPDYRFSTTIRQLEVIEKKNQFLAHVNLEFRIMNNPDEKVLIEHRADRTEPLAKKDLNLFAAAISDLLVSELRSFELLIRNEHAAFAPGNNE